MYTVITYYLRHKPDVDVYREERGAAAGRLREEVEVWRGLAKRHLR